jgi:hypothetical protein
MQKNHSTSNVECLDKSKQDITRNHSEERKETKSHFQTKQSSAALYLALPDDTWKLAFAVCFGTGTLTTTPSANILAPNTLFTCAPPTQLTNQRQSPATCSSFRLHKRLTVNTSTPY